MALSSPFARVFAHTTNARPRLQLSKLLLSAAFFSCKCVVASDLQQQQQQPMMASQETVGSWPYQRPWMQTWNATTTSYRQIRIHNREDIERLYPVIAAWVQKPELASTVEELGIDVNAWPRGRYCRLRDDAHSELKEPALPVAEGSQGALEQYARDLGLGEKTTAAMIESLAWKAQHLAGEHPESPDGFEKHNHRYAQTATVILLSLAQNVATLHWWDDKWPTAPILDDYLLKSNYVPGQIPRPALQKLRDVNVVPNEHGYLVDERYFAHFEPLRILYRYFHRLPQIRSISTVGVTDCKSEYTLFPPKSGNVKRLSLERMDIDPGVLGTVLRVPRALEELRLSIGGMGTTDGASPWADPQVLGTCLVEHRESLQVLDIDLSEGLSGVYRQPFEYANEDPYTKGAIEKAGGWEKYYDYQIDEYFKMDQKESTGGPFFLSDVPTTRPQHVIGSLHGFTSLRRLSIDVETLLGPPPTTNGGTFSRVDPLPVRLVDALPPSLEFLRLYGYSKGIHDRWDYHVEELMRLRDERLPNLQEVEGVETRIKGVKDLLEDVYDAPDDEEYLMIPRPEVHLSWVEA